MSATSRSDVAGRVGQILWPAWLPVVAVLTAKILLWHVNYFKSPGPQYYRVAQVFLAALVIGAWGYIWLRRAVLWRFEVLALAALATVTIVYYEPKAFLACAALFFGSYASGNFAARKLHLELPGPTDRILVGFGIGCGLLIPALFILGLLHLFYPATFLLLLLIPPAVLFRDTMAAFSDMRALHLAWKDSTELRHPMVGIAVVFSFVAALCTLMVALAPSITFDTLQMHLPSVQQYVSTHTISPILQIEYSYFPQGGEILWAVVYSLAGQSGAQLVSVMFFVLFLMIVFRLARACRAERTAAVVGTIWAGTLPFLHWTGSVMKNDMIMAFFQALALYGFLRWLDTRDFRWIVAGVFFMAQSFGVKHVALLGGIPLAMLYAYATWKQPRRWRAAAVLAIVFLLFGTFWAGRTYWLTGNPAYPESAQHAVNGAAMDHGHSILEKAGRYANLPWTILFNGTSTFESPLRSPAGVLLFAFFPLVLFGIRRQNSGAAIACAVFSVVYFAYWASILSTLRYAILSFALLALLIGNTTTGFYNQQRHGLAKAFRISILVTETYCMLIAALGIMIVEINGPQLGYFTHRLDKAAYLRSAMRTYGSLEYLQGAAKRDDSIFGLDNCSRAYAPDPLRFKCLLCPPSGCKTEDLAEKLKEDDTRYLILPVDGEPAGMIQDLIKGGRSAVRMYSDAYFMVYRLSDDAGHSGTLAPP